MRLLPLLLALLLAALAVGPAAASDPVPVPPTTMVPTDPDGDGQYEDLNANGRKDFADVVQYFNQLTWIATNEPVVMFDYNGNGRIDFADVVSLFNELGSSGPTVLIAQSLAPSDEDHTLAAAGINLTVPGGALERTALVRVATVPSPPAPPTGTANLTVYDITIGDQERFAPGIVIEIPYRSSMIPENSAPWMAIQGVRWDAEVGEWVEITTAVDTSRGVVVLETGHLCVAGYTVELQPSPDYPLYAVPFVVHFDSDDNAAIAKAWQGTGHNFTTADGLASSVMLDLYNANNQYREQFGFPPPVPSRFTGDGFIHVYVGNYDKDESGWNPMTKTITVSREPFLPGPGAGEKLQTEMEHELFHAIQNTYVTTKWMDRNRWWTEATAEYASTYVTGGDSLYPVDQAFFSRPLTTVNGDHEYQTAHFVHQLIDRWHPTFRELWTWSTTYTSAYDAVDAWGISHSRSIEATYRNMMAAQFVTTDIMPATWTRVRQTVLDGASPLPGSSTMHIVLDGGGTGTVTPAYRVSTGGASEVTLIDAWSGGAEPLPDGCHVTRFIAKEDGTFTYDYGSDSRESHPFGPTVFTAADGDVIFYTVVNGGTDLASVRIALTKPDARISPQSAEVAVGEEVSYTVQVDNVPFDLQVRVEDQYMNGNVLTAGPGVTDGTAILPPFVQSFSWPGLHYPWFYVRLDAGTLKILQPEVKVT